MSTPVTTPFLSLPQLNRAGSAQWKQIVRQALTDARFASPAIAVTNLGEDQTLSVQIAIQEKYQARDGQVTDETVTPIIKVPIVIPRAGGFSITLPVQIGDEGLLIFAMLVSIGGGLMAE